MNENVTIQQLDPNTFEYQTYSDSDSQLIVQSQLDTVFSASTDYIEYYVYDQNQNLIYPGSTIPLLNYDIRDGDVLLNPQKDLENSGFDIGIYNILYSFYRKRLSSNLSEKYFISNISSDRTEIRLDSNIISNDIVISSTNEFIQYRETAEYFVDFYLNFGNNQTVIANNIKLETEEGIDPTILIKLYEPLPSNFGIKDELWVVEELSDPQAYELDFPFEPIVEDDFTYIAGPNYNLNVIQETSTGGEAFSFNTLLQSDVTSSINQIQNLLNQKEIDINVNYENYANFIHFSSAKIRLENFYYKAGLIESASNQLIQNFTTTSPTSTTPSYLESKAQLTDKIDNIIKNFDGYESFLYFNSGSQYSYPKTTTSPPYQLASTESIEALTWVGNATVGDPYYGGQALVASDYDQDNRNWLYWSIPEYLRDDPANEGYELFVDMVAQYYDNVWVYTKDISNKFDADNRLEYGISKDLVADAIRDFGVKLYASNFNTNDLFTAFLGLTPSGSAFPFPNMTGSLPTESGFEYVDTEISASNDIVPLNNVQKQVYKRIYHNIPYLLKTKGTIAGIRALITSYGIPDTILRISEFGGKDRNESQDYDLKQNVFNYAFDTGTNSTNYISSSFNANSKFPNNGSNTVKNVQFRIKPAEIPQPTNNTPSSNIIYSQSLFHAVDNSNVTNVAIVLEYTGSGFVTGSYDGSIANPYDTYGTLKFIPADGDSSNNSASVFLPFFNGDWWSIQTSVDTITATASLFAANQINGKVGFIASSSVSGFDTAYYTDNEKAFLNFDNPVQLQNNDIYSGFTGSYQEYRFWTQPISESKFLDYTVNPYSVEGNSLNSTPNELIFRAALGSQLSRDEKSQTIPVILPTSIHPRVTGSAIQITQSFSDGTSDYFITSPRFRGDKLYVKNKEFIYQDQVPAGIKNRITDKIYKEDLILAEAPYGFQTSTSSNATISSTTSDVISPMESIQQTSFVSQSYTPSVNYLEVGFSPSNQINDDINAQLGYFNLGDYIGDPRFISSSLDSYPNLDRLRDAYFEKYIKGYDIVDFIRLIKFFDNSLFKMIKDFTPARTSLASGVIVKQHLLERNRLRPAQVSSSLHDYEGLVVNLPKDYSSGSSDFPQYSTEGSALYKFSGGPGGSFNKFNGLQTSPSGSKGLGPDNRFNLTQSWTESFDYGAIDRSVINSLFFNRSSSQYISASYKGIRKGVIHSDQSEFYNGIFSGSYIEVTNGDLNKGCEPYLNIADTPILYKPIFFSTSAGFQPVVTKQEFLNQANYPPRGYAWIASEQTIFEGPNGGTQQVYAIKLSQTDANGIEVINYLDDFSSLRLLFGDASIPYNSKATEYKVLGRTIFSEHALLRIDIRSGVGGNNYLQTVDGVDYYPITSSDQGGSMDWSLEAKTDYTTTGSINTESADNTQQNDLSNPNASTQEQNIYYWNGDTLDALGFFNTGSDAVNTDKIISTDFDFFKNAAYTTPYTSNTPWIISASVVYSSSLNSNSSGISVDSGIYHSASLYAGSGLTIQDFSLGTPVSVQTRAFHINTTGYSSAADAAANAASASDPLIYYSTSGASTFQQGVSVAYSDRNLLDPDIITSLGLVFGKFYYLTNLEIDTVSGNQEYLVGTPSNTTTPGEYSFLISTIFRNPLTTKSPLVGLSVPAITKFRPAPRYVEELGNIAFNSNTVNTQIPGNSGSGLPLTTLGGHPKIATAGTASMDWSFPSLTLAGTAPTLGAGAVSWRTLSGSLALTNNPNFTADFNTTNWPPDSGTGVQAFDFADPSFAGSSNQGSQYDGAIAIDIDALIDTLEQIESNTINIFLQLGYKMTARVMSRNTTDQFKVRMSARYVQTNGSSSTSVVFSEQTSNNGSVFFSNQISSIPLITGLSYVYLFFEVQNINTDSSDIEYAVILEDLAAQATYTLQGDSSFNFYPSSNSYATFAEGNNPSTFTIINPTGTNITYTGDMFQSGSSANPAVMPYSAIPDFYPQAQVDVYLKRTGSISGVPYDVIITSSIYDPSTEEGGYSGSIYSGSTLTFNESPILGIYKPGINFDPTDDATTGSTQNLEGDMYYVEYSMSNFVPGVIDGLDVNTQRVVFQTDSDLSRIAITQSYSDSGGVSTFNATGSVVLRKGNTSNPQTLGQPVSTLNFNLDENASNTRVDVSGSYIGDFFHNDAFRFSIRNSKVGFGSNLHIREITASIFPSQSIWAKERDPFGYGLFKDPDKTGLIVPTYYPGALPFNLAVNCQPLLNNYVNQRINPFIFDIDYNFQGNSIYFSSSLAPVNFLQILSGSAIRANVPVSNYTQFSSISPRYLGAKSTSQELNVWNIGDIGTFGKNPTIELRDAYFGYFNDISDPYPNINDLTRVNLNYLIDEQGNALPPSLEDQLSIDTFEQVFPNTTQGKIAVKLGKTQYTPLSTPSPISRIMEYVTPICYSQNSGNNYSTSIPLSGSGYISRYDNDDESSITFGTFQAVGTSSVVDVVGQDRQSVSYYIDPTEAITTKTGVLTNPYSVSSRTGSAEYAAGSNPGEWGTDGEDLDNTQIVSIQHSVVTSYVSETRRTRDELDLTFKMFTGSNETTQSPFNLEGIDCKVYTDTGKVYLIKDVDDHGWFTYSNLPTSVKVKKRKKGLSFKRYYYTRVPIPGGGIKCKVDWEMFHTLFNFGLMRQTSPRNGAGVQALEWIFKANSGNHTIKTGEKISWKFEGFFKNARGGFQQGLFFPNAYQGAYTPTIISGDGALDYKLDEANKAAAPYWIFPTNDYRFIEMSSSNFNEAYGTGFYQGDLPYEPGFSEYFPGNTEPKTTAFDPIENTLDFEEGDEIRFSNNESFTYTVEEVFAPSENVVSGAGRVKLRLDKPVDSSVNKDFFLVRRKIADPQSLYLDLNFPYGILSSGSISKVIKSTGSFGLTGSFTSGSDSSGLYTASLSNIETLATPGILYPDFPTEYLIQSASVIVNDLISKGVIES